MTTYICTAIQYDTDEEILFLPETVTVVVEDGLTKDELEETLRDAIFDKIGRYVNNFIYEQVVVDQLTSSKLIQ
jgi:hypothetical protein